MPKARSIQIACPEHNRVVRGSYLPGPDGRFFYAADGGFLLQQVRCNQCNGRCAQTLCALHRYNRRGPSTWYPDRIYALPEPKRPRSGSKQRPTSSGGGISIQA